VVTDFKGFSVQVSAQTPNPEHLSKGEF